MKYDVKWCYDEEQEGLDMIHAHIVSFFEECECSKVEIGEDFKVVTIEKGFNDSEVERLVEIFNKGHSFDTPQETSAVTLPISLKKSSCT